MPSALYTALQQRISDLTVRFVDFDIPLDRLPTAIEIDMIAAFKLLAHAEIENYLEDRIDSAISACISQWKITSNINRCVLNLLIRWSDYTVDCKFKLFDSYAELDNIVEKCVSKAKSEIADNNSIKQDALFRLSFSAGFVTSDLSSQLVANLDSYGTARGDVAHKKIGKVRSINGPRDEAKSAKDIIDLLFQFDLDLELIGMRASTP